MAPRVLAVPRAKSHHATQASREFQLRAPYRNSLPSTHPSTQHPVALRAPALRVSTFPCAPRPQLALCHLLPSQERKMEIKISKRRVDAKLLLGMACMDPDTKMLVIRGNPQNTSPLFLQQVLLFTLLETRASRQASIGAIESNSHFFSSSETLGTTISCAE